MTSADRKLDADKKKLLKQDEGTALALLWAGQAVVGASPKTPECRALLQKWFTSSADTEVIAEKLQTCATNIKDLMLKFENGLKHDVPNFDKTYAFTYKASGHTPAVVYLCPLFWQECPADARERNSRAGVIVHEATHCGTCTEDHKYGVDECLKLDTSRAMTNADNYEFFCEDALRLATVGFCRVDLRDVNFLAGTWNELTVRIFPERTPTGSVTDRYDITVTKTGADHVILMEQEAPPQSTIKGDVRVGHFLYNDGLNMFDLHILSEDRAFGYFRDSRYGGFWGYACLSRFTPPHSADNPQGGKLAKRFRHGAI
jgi:hypothetical protein